MTSRGTPGAGDTEARADSLPDLSVNDSGAASATSGGFANTGIIKDSPLTVINQPPTPPPDWPAQVGQVPPLASAFQVRPRLRKRIDAAREATGELGPSSCHSTGGNLTGENVAAEGATADGTAESSGAGGAAGGVVLTQVLTGGGGVGKSQLAASYAVQAVQDGTDLVVWVDTSIPGALIASYAQAASRVQAASHTGQPGDLEADARAFLAWAATTRRSWLVVLDDVTDPEQAALWWPASHTRTGWVLATTRRRDDVLTGGGRRKVNVDVYEDDEALSYLNTRLHDAGKAHLLNDHAAELAAALGNLPLALSHAAAYMISQRVTCGTYLDLYTAEVEKLDELMPRDPDGHGRTPDGQTRRITVTLLLALDAADTSDPVGLARPAMDLAATLDPTGHPSPCGNPRPPATTSTASAPTSRPIPQSRRHL